MAPDDPRSFPSLADLERQYDIPPGTYCGLSPHDMSRAIVAYDGGPHTPGTPVGYMPVGSEETRLGWLRREFGPAADIGRIRLQMQFFAGRVRRELQLDWTLPDEDFDRAVIEGLSRSFPELTEEARLVIAGNYSYSHAR